MEEGGRREGSEGGDKTNERRGAGTTHLPVVEEPLQLLVSCVEAPVRGSWPLLVQDTGGWQIVLQPQ